MNIDNKLNKFFFNDYIQNIIFVESSQVVDGVICDVYKFEGDDEKDLGIITIDAGKSTPLQKVLSGDKTYEGYLQGKGILYITRRNGTKEEFYLDERTQKPFVVKVNVGDTMQWVADPSSSLTVYEVCFPPYEDGRFENIES